MWLSKGNSGKKLAGNGLVAVAIDKDKSSQIALRWAIEHLLSRGHPVILIHVVSTKSASYSGAAMAETEPSFQSEKGANDLFLTFRVLCTCKNIPCLDVTLEDTDVGKALVQYVNYAAIGSLVLGVSKGGFMKKLKQADTPTVVSKGAPDFCTVYVINKGKVSSVRNSTRPVPHSSPLQKQLDNLAKEKSFVADALPKPSPSIRSERLSLDRPSNSTNIPQDKDPSRMPRVVNEKLFSDFSDCATDISFISNDRTSVDLMLSPHYDILDSSSRTPPRLSSSSDQSFRYDRFGSRCPDFNTLQDFSYISQDSGRISSSSSQYMVSPDEAEAEMRRMRLEMKQTMDLYGSACKEALTAKQKALELERSRNPAGTFKSGIDKNSFTSRERIPRQETDKRLSIEKKHSVHDDAMVSPSYVCRYRKYTMEEIESATDNFDPSRKIGEGGYGPVFKCNLDHTSVAVKLLRPDAVQGRMQFNREVEVLSCIRHPNLVLLLGACPEHGFLVYEYMSRGSLDDRLFRRGKTPPLPWQIRFKIAAETATGLHFLHQTKPEPIVHRDLKPANILLDQNYVSKISDVGLARLVPQTADSVTQYRMTSAAGTFCYIDPEYQQTGMLDVRSDVFSLGVLLLQLVTAKPPMAIAYHVSAAIQKGGDAFLEILDPAVRNWPFEETLSLAKLAVQCAEMMKKDRPDLGKNVLPELARLRDFADESLEQMMFYNGGGTPDS